jgi:hypothetical protein
MFQPCPEFVPDYEASAWFGVGAPRGTPAEIVDKLNTEGGSLTWVVLCLRAPPPISASSSPRKRRRWSEEQKRAILAEAFAPDASVSAVARRVDVVPGQIYRWRSPPSRAPEHAG